MSGVEETNGRPSRAGLHVAVLAKVRRSGTIRLRGLRRAFVSVRGSASLWADMTAASRRWAASVDATCTKAAAEAAVDRLVVLRSLLTTGAAEEVRFMAAALRLGAFDCRPDGVECRKAVEAALRRRPSSVDPRLETALQRLEQASTRDPHAPESRPCSREVACLLESPADALALALDLEPPTDRAALVEHLAALEGVRASHPSGRTDEADSKGRTRSAVDRNAAIATLLAAWIARHPSCRLTVADLCRLGPVALGVLEHVAPEDLLPSIDGTSVARALAVRRSGREEFGALIGVATSADSALADRAAAWERIAEMLALVEMTPFLRIPLDEWIRELKVPTPSHPDAAPESVRRSLAGRTSEAAKVLLALSAPVGERWHPLGRRIGSGPWLRSVRESDAIAAFERSTEPADRRRLHRAMPACHDRLAEAVGRCQGIGREDLRILMDLALRSTGAPAVRTIAAHAGLRDALLASPGALKWLLATARAHPKDSGPILAAIPPALWKRWSRGGLRSAAASMLRSSRDASQCFLAAMLSISEFERIFAIMGVGLSLADYERILRAWQRDGAREDGRQGLLSAMPRADWAGSHALPPLHWRSLASVEAELAPETVDALLGLAMSGSSSDLADLVAAKPDRFLPVLRETLGDALACIVAAKRYELLDRLDAMLGAEGRLALVGSFERPEPVKRLARRLPKAARPSLRRSQVSSFARSIELPRAGAIVLEVACLSSLTEIGFLSKCMRHATKSVDSAKPGAWFDAFYTTYERPKRRGGTRTITAPDRALKRFQRCLLENAFARVPQHDAVHGFVRGRGIASNAAVHVGQPLVVNVDVKGFFPSTSWQRVVEASRFLADGRIPRSAALFVADLCCYRGALPTGSPTSPAIANLVLRRIDRALATRCAKIGVRYTRYADDLTFSGDDRAKRVIPFVRSLLAEVGYELDLSKTQLYRRGRQQIVTGLTVNDRVNVKRSDRRRLRAAVHARVAKGTATWYGRPMDDAALLGHVAMLHAVDPAKAAALRERLAPVVTTKKTKGRRHG